MFTAVSLGGQRQVFFYSSIEALLTITHDHSPSLVQIPQSMGEVVKKPSPMLHVLLWRNTPCKIDCLVVGVNGSGKEEHIIVYGLGEGSIQRNEWSEVNSGILRVGWRYK